MNKKKLWTIVLSVLSIGITAQNITLDEADRKARETLSKMTLDEKLELIDGNGFDVAEFEHLGIKKLHMYDGPIGVRGTKANNANYPSGVEGAIAERLAPTNSTAYPALVMLAATWNRQLAHDYGYALGRDSRARGINIILGPGVNIHRSPRNSRNFEYMGEDPYLAAQLAGEYIIGVQENPGVIACVKHFAANNPESGRYDVSSDVDERTMQEIYLPPFRHAVEKAKVGSIMSSYNRLNGTWTSENKWLMHDLLRDTWNFPFISMTDWGAAHHTDWIVKYGVDLEMPGGSAMSPKRVKPLIEKGELSVDDIDKKVMNILRTSYYFNLYEHSLPDLFIELDNKENAQTAYDVAAEGFVMLKNENNILPIGSDIKKICITGHNAMDYVSGGGSSIVTPHQKVSPYDVLSQVCKKNKIKLEYKELEVNPSVVEEACYIDAKTKKKGISAQYFMNTDMEGTPFVSRIEKTVHSPWLKKSLNDYNPDNSFSARFNTWVKVSESGEYIFSLSGDDGFRMSIDGKRVIDDWHSGTARLHTLQMTLEADKVYSVEIEYFQGGGGCSVDFNLNRIDPNGKKRVTEELKAYDMILVFEGLDKNLEAEGGDRSFTLNDDRESVLRLAANSGVPTVAIINAGGNIESQGWEPKIDGLIWAWYSGQEGNRALADILFGKLNPSGKLPMSFERRAEDNPSYYTYSDQGNKHVAWTEGIFIGYRGYDKTAVEPLYPFGFGLSYTTFALSDLEVDRNKLTVTFTIKNTGDREGAEVVQLYVGKADKSSPVARPMKELKQFEKVNLQSGESKSVTLQLTEDDFKYYDVNTHSWMLDKGKYNIFVGTSAKDIKLTQQITM